jgi:hypothetical protein
MPWRVPNAVVDGLELKTPKRVGRLFASKMWNAGLVAKRVREVIQEVGAGIAQAVLPPSLNASARRAYEEAVREVYLKGKEFKVEIDDGLVDEVSWAIEDYTQRVENGMLEGLELDWVGRIDSAVAASLGPAAPASAALWRELKKDSVKSSVVLTNMGGSAAVSNISKMRRAIGIAVEHFLNGAIEIKRPSLWVVGSVHGTVFDHCLAAVLRRRHKIEKDNTASAVQHTCDQVSYIMENLLPSSRLVNYGRF